MPRAGGLRKRGWISGKDMKFVSSSKHLKRLWEASSVYSEANREGRVRSFIWGNMWRYTFTPAYDFTAR